MDRNRREAMRNELKQLVKKQTEFLEPQTFGGASHTDLLEYERRQEIIHDLCEQLEHSTEEAA